MKFLVHILFAIALGTPAALATTINVFESDLPSGDYDVERGFLEPFGLGTFSVPLGTTELNVFGDLTCQGPSACTDLNISGLLDSTDAFFFSLGPNQEVTAISVSTVVRTTDIVDSFTNINIFTQSLPVGRTLAAGSVTDQSVPFGGGTIGEGTHSFQIDFFDTFPPTTDTAVQYVISAQLRDITVSPVPLPAGLPLLLAGLGAFGLMRSRKRT